MAVSSEEFPFQPSFKPHLAAGGSRASKAGQRRFGQVAADNRGSHNFNKLGFARRAATRIAGIRAAFHNRCVRDAGGRQAYEAEFTEDIVVARYRRLFDELAA